jgi:flagellar biosynthesis protein FlhG
LASFDFDQAEGLRRMLAGPKPRIVSFLSATPDEEKSAMLMNLGASLARAGSDVLLLDANSSTRGIASRLDGIRGATLMEVARQERALNEVVQTMPQGFCIALLTRGATRAGMQDATQTLRMANTFDVLAKQKDVIMVDAELGADDTLPIPAMSSGEIVVQVSTTAASIKLAYAIIKRLNSQLGRRPFGVLVTGASDKEAQVIYENMAQAASRYLAVQLNSMGSVPADEHLKRAAYLGRPVVDAFPLAGASVAFRRLAERFALTEMATAGFRGMSAAGTNVGA